jgi:hypothetical protein
MMSSVKRYLLTFAVAALVVWASGTFALIYFYPHVFYNAARRAVVKRGLGIKAGGIPVNTLYALPALASPSLSKSPWVLTGNRDTLYTVGVLDLGKGPEILHVPEMAGRYYSIEFVDPWLDIFADVGRRITGTRAGDYLISGPHWNGPLPEGVTKIASPNNSVLVIGRVLVEGDGDLSTAYGLAKQIQLTPQSRWRPPIAYSADSGVLFGGSNFSFELERTCQSPICAAMVMTASIVVLTAWV